MTRAHDKTSYPKAEAIFRQHNGLLRTMEAIRLGIHPRVLYRMRDAGILDQVDRGLFRFSLQHHGCFINASPIRGMSRIFVASLIFSVLAVGPGCQGLVDKWRETHPMPGDVQMVIKAVPPAGKTLTPAEIQEALDIYSMRVFEKCNGSVIIEVPRSGYEYKVRVVKPTDPEVPRQVLTTRTRFLRFLDAGQQELPPGTRIRLIDSATGQPVAMGGTVAGESSETGESNTSAGSTESAGSPQVVEFTTDQVIVTANDLQNAYLHFDSNRNNKPMVYCQFTPDGGAALAKFTTEHPDGHIAIALDDEIISCPGIRAPIPDGVAAIDLQRPLPAVELIAEEIHCSKPIPVEFEILEYHVVGRK
jgi:preprotein translocase subunit SecD